MKPITYLIGAAAYAALMFETMVLWYLIQALN